MATKHKSSKAKAPQKAKPKPVKKLAKPSVKPSKQKTKSAAKPSAKLSRPAAAKAKAVVRGKKPVAKVGARSTNVRVPTKQYAAAGAALESGIKLMYAEDYGKAVKAFNKLI